MVVDKIVVVVKLVLDGAIDKLELIVVISVVDSIIISSLLVEVMEPVEIIEEIVTISVVGIFNEAVLDKISVVAELIELVTSIVFKVLDITWLVEIG